MLPSAGEERRFWNEWNTTFREGRDFSRGTLDLESMRRGRIALEWVASLPLPGRPRILEIGCGTGWLSGELARRGTVTAVDLADAVIARARERHPEVEFLAGDVTKIVLSTAGYDLVVALETLAYVRDQPAFLERVHDVLRPEGYLLLTTVNPFVYLRRSDIEPTPPGQIRRWLTRRELRALLEPEFRLARLATIFPGGNRGVLRLINSHKLTGGLGRVLGAARLERLKERAGLGRTIVVLARRRGVP